MKKILVVEDTKSILEMYTTKLHLSGFETYEAVDGERGLFLALEKHPDLILLDLIMPKMDGMTVMKKLREDTWGKKVPIILLTNISPDSDRALEAINRDAPAYYLLKQDTTPSDIVDKIREVLHIQSS